MSKPSLISRVIGDKRRWRAYKARKRQLPESYRTAVEAIEKYMMYFVPAGSESAVSMFEDLADLFEQAAASGSAIRGIVGDTPVEFVETFVANYAEGGYVPPRQRERLIAAIDEAACHEVAS